VGDYATLSEVRAGDGMDDITVFPDATINEAIDFAEELIDRYTGTSWVYKAFTVTMSGNGRRSLLLKDDESRVIINPRTLTSVEVDGVAVASVAGWGLHPDGVVVRDSGVFDSSTVGRNVVIVGTAGLTDVVPKDIAWCARTLARQYALDLVSRIPDRALQIQNDFGSVTLAQAGNHPDRPTSLPEVNARLARRRQISYVFS